MLLGSAGTLGSTLLESVVESAVDIAEVLHAAGTGGSATESLLAPVDCRKSIRKHLSSLYRPANGIVQYGASGDHHSEGRRFHVHFRILADGYPHEEQVCFWMWRERRPIYPRDIPIVVSPPPHCFPQASPSYRCETSTRDIGIGYVLTTPSAEGVRLVVALAKAGGSLRYSHR